MPVVAAIRHWLEGAFPESNVRLEDDHANGISRFLIEERSGGRARVFEVAATGLQPDADGVVRYLIDQGVAGRLQEAPAWRARLGPGETIEYFQQMHLRCDGRSYFILLNAKQIVLVMDAKHRPLTRAPSIQTIFTGDLGAVPVAQWHQQIRDWRGVDQ